MFDILFTLYEFISGLGYMAYTVVSALDNAISFFEKALPFTLQFLSSFTDVPIFTAFVSLTLGLSLIRFLWKGV